MNEARKLQIQDFNEFLRLLLQRQAEVLGREQTVRSQFDEQVITDPGDLADISVIDTNADYFLRLANNQKQELYEIQEALDRIHRGVYGLCMSCGDYIATDRLKRLPYARLCIDCQTAMEKQNRKNRLSSIPKGL